MIRQLGAFAPWTLLAASVVSVLAACSAQDDSEDGGLMREVEQGIAACSFPVTTRSYKGAPDYWGTIVFRNTNTKATQSPQIAFKVPSRVTCDYDPSGWGHKQSGTTCTYSRKASLAIKPGASYTFNFSTDSEASFTPGSVTIRDSSCAGTPTPTPTPQPMVPAGYELVWADEFSGDNVLPDSKKWNYDTEANSTGWYNNELQYYAVKRLENSRVSGGRLIITARKEVISPAPPDYNKKENYTSARLITRGLASWTYGFVDVRAKLPCGKGTWPAIWMLGTADDWPASGEIDIMEQVGQDPNRIEGTIHTKSTDESGDGNWTRVVDPCSSFHDYHVLWTPQQIDIGVDGRVYHTYKNDGRGRDSWPFDDPQYLLLNLAIGGDMGGAVDDSIFPVQYEIDYVRAYQMRK